MSQSKKFKELINNTFELSQTVDGVKTVYVSGSDVEFHIKKHFGNVYCYYDNTTDLKADFDQFNRLHIYDFVRLLQALKFDYNPCENFDKHSNITVSHTGTIGTTSNSTMTNKVNAFDSSSLVTDGETIGNGGNTTTLNNSDGTTEHTHGNIGVQTVSNMILQQGTGEAFLRFNNFVEHYLNRWICGCMVAYGDEDNEIVFSPDTEYATKTELETLAQSTSDALNSLTNTVNSHGESITTLDNSLGATISDLREAENDIQALDGVVNNLGGDVSNHETRIEALESAPSIFPTMRDITNECTITVPSGTVAKKKILCDGHNVTVFLFIQGLTRATYVQIANISHPTINFDIGDDINLPLPIAHLNANPLNLVGAYRTSGGNLILSTAEQSFNNVWVWIGFSVRLNN